MMMARGSFVAAAMVAAMAAGLLVMAGCESPQMGVVMTPARAVAGAEAPAPPARGWPGVTPARPVAPDVKAGWADDNAQYNRYLEYLDRFLNPGALKLDVADRIVFTVRDSAGRSVPNCDLTVRSSAGGILCRRRTYADGRAMFFPHEFPSTLSGPRRPMKVEVRWGREEIVRSLDMQDRQNVELRFGASRGVIDRAPLDVAFIIDTTGSMADEIDRLRQTLEAIHYQVTQMTPRPDVRFAMVLYRDRGDEYITRVTPFTGDIQHFAGQLKSVAAAGGGDYAEDIHEALRVTTSDLDWRTGAAKLAFLLGDAPPHLDYGRNFTYLDFMRIAAERGIKVTAIGASGLDDRGEYVFRQLSQYTMGMFVFLTYGEQGQTRPESPTGVSHHTGDNWVSLNLDAIIVKAIARELSYLADRPVEAGDDYFQARAADGIDGKAVLETLFADCARQLVDFSQAHLEAGTAAAVVAAPAPAGDCPAELSRSLGDELSLAISRQKCFKLVEREDLKRVLDEVDMNWAFDTAVTAAPAAGAAAAVSAVRPAGALPLPAKLLVLYRLRSTGDQYQMFVKLVRVQTGEILSASMLKIDRGLIG
jgi:hypothetical protein